MTARSSCVSCWLISICHCVRSYVLVDEIVFYYGHMLLHQTDLFARVRPLAPKLFSKKINMCATAVTRGLS